LFVIFIFLSLVIGQSGGLREREHRPILTYAKFIFFELPMESLILKKFGSSHTPNHQDENARVFGRFLYLFLSKREELQDSIEVGTNTRRRDNRKKTLTTETYACGSRRFTVLANERLTAFLELYAAIHRQLELE
jgi:hypothetical protein